MGKVYLVGAGPGDPELLTVKALRLIERADLVLHDSLVSAEILALIPASAERIDVGKRCGTKWLSQDDINSLLVASASKHETVVRLKGGDPLLFGRAAEEIQALRASRIEFEVVPGISAAFGAAAAAKVSWAGPRQTPHPWRRTRPGRSWRAPSPARQAQVHARRATSAPRSPPTPPANRSHSEATAARCSKPACSAR